MTPKYVQSNKVNLSCEQQKVLLLESAAEIGSKRSELSVNIHTLISDKPAVFTIETFKALASARIKVANAALGAVNMAIVADLAPVSAGSPRLRPAMAVLLVMPGQWIVSRRAATLRAVGPKPLGQLSLARIVSHIPTRVAYAAICNVGVPGASSHSRRSSVRNRIPKDFDTNIKHIKNK